MPQEQQPRQEVSLSVKIKTARSPKFGLELEERWEVASVHQQLLPVLRLFRSRSRDKPPLQSAGVPDWECCVRVSLSQVIHAARFQKIKRNGVKNEEDAN